MGHGIIQRCSRAFASALALFVMAQVSTQASAQPEATNPVCPDAQLLGPKLITDICWGCLFPLRIAGAPIGSGPVPDGATDQLFCVCPDAAELPSPGITLSLWEPARVIELVKVPGCMPALGGIRQNLGLLRTLGAAGRARYDSSDKSYYNAHYYAFPLLVMLDLFFPDRCSADHFTDFDVLFLSELIPTWSDEQLAFFAHPEAAVVANPVAQAACLADATAATTSGQPIDSLFWCAGAWGSLYPFSGRTQTLGGRTNEMSLAATRLLAMSHRLGWARRTMGDDALCEYPLAPILPKSQYRMSQFFPLAEANSNHAIGASEMRWGVWRTIPGIGDDQLYILWRWNDCCLTWL